MTHYDSHGNAVGRVNYRAADDDVIYDLSQVADHGLQPDFEKSDFAGTVVKIGGIDGPEDFPKGPVYWVLQKRMQPTKEKPGTEADTEYYGVMYAASSAIVQRVLQMAEAGALPFYGVPRLVESKTSGNEYWRLDVPTREELATIGGPRPKGRSK